MREKNEVLQEPNQLISWSFTQISSHSFLAFFVKVLFLCVFLRLCFHLVLYLPLCFFYTHTLKVSFFFLAWCFSCLLSFTIFPKLHLPFMKVCSRRIGKSLLEFTVYFLLMASLFSYWDVGFVMLLVLSCSFVGYVGRLRLILLLVLESWSLILKINRSLIDTWIIISWC